MKLHNKQILKLASIINRYEKLFKILKWIYFKCRYFLFINKNFNYKINIGKEIFLPYFNNKDFFFGYYHNTPWSYDDKFIAINSVLDSKTIQINIINLLDSKIFSIDNTTLWNFQQGPMLGWFPEKHIVYYNKLIDNKYKTVLYDIKSKVKKDYDFPIQCIHPNGDYYLSINYFRMHEINRDYGYIQECDNFQKESSANKNGIWKCYFDVNKKPELIISFLNLNKIGINYKDHYNNEINHVLFSDDGYLFLFIHRYKKKGRKYSQLILADIRFSDFNLRIINNLFVSHMCWIDNENIFYFGDDDNGEKGYYIYNIIESELIKIMLDNNNDGHPNINKDKNWIILDTYPDKECNSHLYLYNIISLKLIKVGKFQNNMRFHGYNRCDLHPRWNNQGTQVMIDSSYKGRRFPLIIELKEVINLEY